MIRNAGLISFAVATALWASPASAQSREADAANVYSAAFDFLFSQYKRESPGTIVLMDSTSPDAGSVAYKGKLDQPHHSAIDRETIEDFEQLNRRPSLLSKSAFSYRLPIILLSLPEYFRLDSAGRRMLRDRRPYIVTPEPGNFMDALAAKFPDIWGLTGVSRIGFNKARTQALVLVTHSCGYCWHSETLVFRKLAGAWVLQERIPLQSSDGIGPGETRYLGVNSQFLPRLRKTQDSTRKAVADSIARDKMPRRIRGTATNRVTGKPFLGAQVILISHKSVYDPKDAVPDIKQRRVVDSKGRFEFRDTHIGLNTVILGCPGTGFSQGMGLDMQGFYLFPATDTVVNLTAPDIRPCWLPRRIHRIESGELESVPGGVAAAESDDANVFAAVVAALYPADSVNRQTALVTQRTYERCKRLAECPSIKFNALLRERVVDSSTVREFRTRSRVVRAITLPESQRAGITLLADGERQYLNSEGPWINYGQAESGEPGGFWKAITTNYPGTVAIVSFAAPGFGRERNEALVEVMIETPNGGEENETMLLRNTAGTWAVAKRHVESAIVSGKFVGGRCEAVTPDSIPTVAELSTISGDYRFSLISDTGDGEVFSWRARFSADTTPLPNIDLNKLTPKQREGFIQQRDHRFPWFEVLDPKTGERHKYADAGNYVESAGRSFRSKSGMMQFDGSGYVIDIQAVETGSLFGAWQAFSFGVRFGADGFAIPDPAGHFCAARVSSPQ